MAKKPSITPSVDPNYWALALNPKEYRIFDAITHLPIDWWATTGRPIRRGDQTIIWQYFDRQRRRGVVALGKVVDGPEKRDDADNPYHVIPMDPARVAKVERVGVHYIPLKEPLWEHGPHKELVTSLSKSFIRRTVFDVKVDRWNAVVSAIGQGVDGDIEESAESDVEETKRRTDLTPTQKEALVQARRGQGRFRQDVLKQWSGGCAVVGATVQSVLRASHIKPWRKSNDDERLDPANGLPLVANLDALFNDGLIGFDDDGGMLISPFLSQEDRSLLYLGGRLQKRPTARQRGYLAHHRNQVFRQRESSTSNRRG